MANVRRTVWEKKAALIHLVILILIVKTCDKRRKELASKRTAKYPAELARNDRMEAGARYSY